MAGGVLATIVIAGVYSFTASAASQKNKLQPLKPGGMAWLLQGQPPNGVVGQKYPGFAFCSPTPPPGQFCGKVLQKNPVTTNPTGGVPNYTFKAGVGLPAGLKLDMNGNLSGKPTKAGKYTFQICATDRAKKKVCNTIKDLVVESKKAPTEPKKAVKKYPQATMDIASGMFRYFTVGDASLATAPSFGRLVREFNIEAPGYTLLTSSGRERAQTHFCYDTDDATCGQDCGRCFGANWDMKTPDGCLVEMTLYGMEYDKAANQTKFILGVVGGSQACMAAGSSYSFSSAELVGSQTLSGGGASAVVRLTYEVTSENGLAFKKTPDFTVTVGAERELKPGEVLPNEKDPVMGQ